MNKNKPKVAFLCTHNACRSQIAEALGRKLAGDAFEPFSAGTEKQDHLDPGAVKWMKELHGVDMEKTQRSKTPRDIPAADIVILMGCGIACPAMKAAYEENWGLDDPSGKSREEYEKTIRIIEQRILDLKEKIQKEWK